MSDETDIGVVIETDATAAVHAVDEASDVLIRMIGTVQGLEKALQRVFTDVIPEGVEKVQGLAEAMRSLGSLAAQLETSPKNVATPRQINQTAQRLATGGPATQLRTAVQRGVVANIRTDPSLQEAQLEREMEARMRAREEQYRRARGQDGDVLENYRGRLNNVGDNHDRRGVSREEWMAQTEREVATFNTKMAEEIGQTYQRAMRKALPGIFQTSDEVERDARARSAASRLSDYGARRGVEINPDDLYGVYQQESLNRVGADAVAQRRSAELRDRQQANFERTDAGAYDRQHGQGQRQAERDAAARDRYEQTEAERQNRQRDAAQHTYEVDQARQEAQRRRQYEQDYGGLLGDRDAQERRAGQQDYSDARYMDRQRTQSQRQDERYSTYQDREIGNAPANAAKLERDIIQLENRINELRAKGNEEQREGIKLLEQQIGLLRQEQEQYTKIVGGEEAAALQRARSERLQTPTHELTDQQRAAQTEDNVRRRLAMRQGQMSYGGGLPMMGIQAHEMANYAVLGGAIGAAGYAGSQVVAMQNSLDGMKQEAGATDGQMSALARDIMAVGSASNHSLKDLTEATDSLVKAGYSTQQAGAMLKPIGDLATATQSKVQDAADVTTEVMKTFSIAGSQAPMVANALAEISTHSKVSLDDMGKAFKSAGQFAEGTGMQFNDVLAAFGAMSQAGMKDGASLGSGLRALIEALDNPTKKLQEQLSKVGLTVDQVNVQTNGLGGALQNLQSHGFSASDAMAGLQARAFASYNALSQNVDVYNKLDASVLKSTAATDGAGERLHSFEAQWTQLLNAVTAFAYEGSAPLLKTLGGMMSGLGSVVNLLNKAGPAVALFGTALGAMGLAAAIQFLGKMAGGLVDMIPALTSVRVGFLSAALAEGDFSAASGVATTMVKEFSLALLASPFVAITAAITLVSLAYEGISYAMSRATAAAEKSGQAAQDEAAKQADLKDRMSQLDGFIGSLIDRHEELSKHTDQAGIAAETASQRFASWGLQLDSTGTHVDTLIGKLNALKLATQQAMVASMQRQENDLKDQVNSLNRNLNGGGAGSTLGKLRDSAAYYGTGLTGSSDTEVRKIIAKGNLSSADLDRISNLIHAGNGSKGILDVVNNGMKNASQLDDVNKQAGEIASQLPTAQTLATPGAQQAQQRQQQELLTLRKRMADINAMPAGEAKIRARDQFQKNSASTYASLQSDASKVSGGNAQVTSNLMNTSAANSIAQAGGVEHPGMSQKEYASRASRYLDQAHHATNQKDRDAAYAQYKQAYISAHPDLTGSELDDLDAKDGMAETAAGQRDAKRGAAAGRRADGNEASTTGKDMADLLKDMQGTAAMAPDRAAVQPQLQQMGSQYVSMARSQATDQGKRQQLSGSQLQRAVDDAVDKADQEITKVIEGNAAAAAKVVADAAERSADANSGSKNLAASRGQGGDPAKGLQDIQAAYAKAAAARVDDITKQWEATNSIVLKPGQALPATLSDQIAESNKKFTATTSKALLEYLNAVYEGAQELTRKAFQGQQQGISAQRAQLAAVNNNWGNTHLGDTYKWAASQQSNTLDIREAQLGVSKAQADSANAKDNLGEKQNLYTADPQNEEVAKAFTAAQKEVEATNQSLAQAKEKLTELTTTGEDFASTSSAIAAAWAKASADMKLDQTPLQRLADGLTGQIQNADQSLTTFFTNLTSGTMKGSQAFKELGVALFSSLEQAAAKALADSAIKYLISLGSSLIGGGTGVPGAQSNIDVSGLKAWQGTVVPRRFAQGGMVQGDIPTRDSVPALLAPGEAVLNQDAVSMLGSDTINHMNSAGNRVQSGMPTVQQAMPQQKPAMTNVYVVAPSYQPPPSPRDIVATISNDIMTGGATKQLIKAVAAGTA